MTTGLVRGLVWGAENAEENSTDVTLAGLDYATISGQEITLGQIDLSTDVTGDLTASDITADAGEDIVIVLGDSAGSNKVIFKDSGGTAIASIDSDGGVVLATYQRDIRIPANSTVLGPTSPSPTSIGTFRGLGFDADAEEVFISFEVPDDWDGVSDMELEIYWSGASGDTIADTETVKFDISYRVRDFIANDVIDGGTAETGTVTYTQSGAGTDKATLESHIVLDYDSVNQPLVKGEIVGIQFSRDVTTDTYSGAAIVYMWEVKYNSVSIPKG